MSTGSLDGRGLVKEPMWREAERRALLNCAVVGSMYGFAAWRSQVKVAWFLAGAVALQAALVALRRPWTRFPVGSLSAVTLSLLALSPLAAYGCITVPIIVVVLAPLLIVHVRCMDAIASRMPQERWMSIRSEPS